MSTQIPVSPSSFWSRIGNVFPMILTFIALGSALWWGHHVSWTAPNRVQIAASHERHEDWCAEHNVPESTCILCKKDLMKAAIAAEPAFYRDKGEEVRFAHAASAEVYARAGVTTGTTSTQDVEPRLDAPAQTLYEPERVARVAVRLPGVIRWVGVRLGERVEAGATIALVESAEVGTAKAALMRTLAEYQAAAATRDRTAVSTEAGVRTKAELAEADAKARVAQVAVFEAEQALLNLGFTLSATEIAALSPAEQISLLRTIGLPQQGGQSIRSANLLPVVAPRAGVVAELTAVEGAAIEAGSMLAIIADTSVLRVHLAIPGTDAGSVATGQVVRFHTRDGGEATGTIQAVAPEADVNTRLVSVIATIANGEGRLRVNQVGTAIISLGPPQTAVVIPPAAIQWDGTTAYVFIKRTDTTYRGLKVPVLARTAEGIAVGRLRAGEEVALTGTAVLKAGIFHDRFGAGCTDD
jgi:membrane fusion protein, heavy metal efflux system